MRNAWGLLLGALLMTMTRAAAEDATPLLIVERAPADGLVIARVDLTWALGAAAIAAGAPQLRATLAPDGATVPAQFVPDADYDPLTRATGAIVLKAPSGGDFAFKLTLEPPAQPSPAQEIVHTKSAEIRFAAGTMAGLPSAFVATQKKDGRFSYPP